MVNFLNIFLTEEWFESCFSMDADSCLITLGGRLDFLVTGTIWKCSKIAKVIYLKNWPNLICG